VILSGSSEAVLVFGSLATAHPAISAGAPAIHIHLSSFRIDIRPFLSESMQLLDVKGLAPSRRNADLATPLPAAAMSRQQRVAVPPAPRAVGEMEVSAKQTSVEIA
jgi:hypothetical protein